MASKINALVLNVACICKYYFFLHITCSFNNIVLHKKISTFHCINYYTDQFFVAHSRCKAMQNWSFLHTYRNTTFLYDGSVKQQQWSAVWYKHKRLCNVISHNQPSQHLQPVSGCGVTSAFYEHNSRQPALIQSAVVVTAWPARPTQREASLFWVFTLTDKA